MLAEREPDLEVLLERIDVQRLEPACLGAEPRRAGRPCSAGPRQSASAEATASAAAAFPSRNAARVSASSSSNRTASTRASFSAYPSAEPTIDSSPSAARRRAM